MDQYFSEFVSLIKINDTIPSINTLLSFDDQEDVNFFLSRERHFHPNLTSEQQLITRLHNYLSILTNTTEVRTWNIHIDNILKETILKQMWNDFTEVQRNIQDILDKPKQLTFILKQKSIKDDHYHRLTASPRFRSVDRKPSPLPPRLSPEPNRAISANRDRNRSVLSESGILDGLSRASRGLWTLKNILPILHQLVFDIKHNYIIQTTIKQFNTNFEKIHQQWKDRITPQWIVTGDKISSEKLLWNPLAYLASIGAYPTLTMMKHERKTFTGQWITGATMAHIDIHHILHAEKQYRSSKMNSSLSFDFNFETFHQLFQFIEQLSHMNRTRGNVTLNFILNVCLRLFTTHLKYLLLLISDDNRNLLSKEFGWNEDRIDKEWKTWFDVFLSLATNQSENTIASRQAAKAIVYILEKQIFSFTDRLLYMSQHILENRYSILTEEFSIALADNINLMTWIDLLYDEHEEKNQTWTILNSLMNHYSHSTKSVQRILERFQRLIFVRLIHGDKNTSLISVFIRYLSLLFEQCMIDTDLFISFLVQLSTLNVIEDRIRSITIFMAILPLLSDFILKYITHTEMNDKPQFRYIAWLLGRISYLLISGQPSHLLETKYTEMLKSPLFSGGCEINPLNETLFHSNMARYSQFTLIDYSIQTISNDQEFLLSVYNNTDQGTQLLSKMRNFTKDKHRLLQKSIEQYVNKACAHLFAVYLKHYRRVNLAKEELSHNDTNKPHEKLLSLFEYAHRIQMTFATVRGQGGNCDELYEQIRTRTHFLLCSVKESHWIPKIERSLSATIVVDSQRQSKSNYSRLLQQTFDACLRFKTLMIDSKKWINQKINHEETIHRAIVNYVYGDQNRWDFNEILQCMSYQYERAMFRWITYRFIHTFLQKCIQIEQNEQMLTFLTIFLSNIRSIDVQWSYLENISTVNNQWKEEIGKVYHSIIHVLLLLNLSQNSIKLGILVFYLLNLSYTADDIQYLRKYEVPQRLFPLFLTSHNQSISYEMKCLAYHWFRLYILHLWKYSDNDENIQTLFEEKCIFNELKHLFSIEKNQVAPTKISLRHIALGSEKYEETNQYLILLLRSVTVYEHVRKRCATLEYFNQLWQMYQCSTNLITILLVLKIVRQIIFSLPQEQAITLMKSFLQEILFTISNSIRSKEKSSEIITELIYIYRMIISIVSPWQLIAIEHIFHIIFSNYNSFISNDADRINHLLACLSILGGYIHPFGIGSIVQIYAEDQFDQETQLGVILETNPDSPFPFLVQYCQTNQTRWVIVDQLRIELDVLPPYLLDLPISHANISKIFDALIYFIELDESLFDSLLILSLKRRSIGVLFRLMTGKKLVEIFMEKPYAAIIAKLSTTALSTIHRLQPTDLYLLNKRHLEQYCLSLDRCEHQKHITDDTEQYHIWHNSLLKEEVSMINSLDNNQWKPIGSKQFVDDFKQGRIGNEDICIVSMLPEIIGQWMLEECGTHHRFPGRMYLISETGNTSAITFTVDNLRLSQGKWYFCIRLLESRFVQIGWATNGFNPSHTIGVGQDQYSWSYDGSQGMLYHQIESPFIAENVHWNGNDVCGCGIEIDGVNTRINYWLNGHFLGTAFAHDFLIGSTETICNMRPNRSETTYYPCVTLRVNDTSSFSTCEWIFSPEDMNECPLPNGYKPLLVPTILTLVRYPFSAYMLSTDDQYNLYRSRVAPSKIFLRDFINQHHLETKFLVAENRLIVTEECDGFPFMIDYCDSWTMSFDFELSSNHSKEDNIHLLTLGSKISMKIPFEKVIRNTRIAIVFYVNEQQIKTYINHEYKTLNVSITTPFELHILSKTYGKIRNLAFWKNALPEEQIRYLFDAGLTHIASDHNRLTEYLKIANTWTFKAKQESFLDGSLVPMHEPFTIEKWHKIQCESDTDEWKYFETIVGTDRSTIQLNENTNYLVLDKTIHPWSEYTLIIDIQIDHLPTENDQLILITLNPDVSIYLTHEAKLCLTNHQTKTDLRLKLNEYVRLMIVVKESILKLYINGVLYLDISTNQHQLLINDNHIDLFRQHNIIKNNIFRIKCKSITFITKCITDINDDLKSSNYSLEYLVTPPYSLIAPSLILYGYDSSLIRSVLEQYTTRNLYMLDEILRQQSDVAIKMNQNNNLLARMNPLIDKCKLQNLLPFTNVDTDEKIIRLGTVLFENWNTLQESKPSLFSDKNWFDQAVDHLNINKNFHEWIQDQSPSIIQGSDLTHQLFDLNRNSSEKNLLQISTIDQHWKKTQYSHQNIPYHQLITLRIACEHGLISVYAHYVILTILKVWSLDGSTLFPLEIFGNYTFLVTLFRLLDYHYNNTRLHTDEDIDRMSLLIKTILTIEIKQLMKNNSLVNTTSLLYQLQKNLSIQMIQLITDPSLLITDDNQSMKMIQKPNLKFILKLFNLFLSLLTELSIRKQINIDILIPIIFPTIFIEYLFDLFLLFDNQHKFSRDEIEQTHRYFDLTADFQLIDYINQHLMTSLPMNIEDNSIHFKSYPSLWHIPIHCIQTRIKFSYALNVFIEKLLSFVDLSLPIGQSFVTDKFRSSRSYILRTTKLQLFERALAVTALPSENNILSVNFDTLQAISTITTKTMFYQGYEQLHSNAHILFRRQNERLWRAQYLGMHSTDAGGPYRDSITCICGDICSTRLSLFILCPNGRMNDGLNRDRWIPNVFPPNKSIPMVIKKQYRFIGQLMGMAIRKHFYLDLKFPTFLWKQLVNDEVTLEDIEAIDIQSFNLINQLEKTFDSPDQLIDTENDVLSSILEELRFEVVSASGQTFELVSGGHDISITWQNLNEYCSTYRQYRLQEFSRQIEFIRQGLYSVIPGYFLCLFTARELEEAVCGKGEIDIELLKRNTTYGGNFRLTSGCIQHFWKVLSTKFTEEQKKLFLKFVWGRSTLPSRDEEFISKFVINPYEITNGPIDGALPRAHTCGFTLDLPEYSSTNVMYDRLNYAITNCSSIDGDGNMNEMPVFSDFN
ncbi:hypothetical protein I4U23_011038 [Adineta vaga]|nr:hypothetical protein I4U23_011038 [Adineta vaga]